MPLRLPSWLFSFVVVLPIASRASGSTPAGAVQAGNTPISGASVTLYDAARDWHMAATALGAATDANGKIPISEFESPIDRFSRRLSMSGCRNPLCEVSNRMAALLLAAFLLCVAPAAGARTLSNDRTLQGTIASGGHGLAGYQVSLFGSFIQSGPPVPFQ